MGNYSIKPRIIPENLKVPAKEAETGSSREDPFINPGPLGNIPRNVSLPTVLNPLLDWHQEWLYYVGCITSTTGQKFSILVEILRTGNSSSDNYDLILGFLAIGKFSEKFPAMQGISETRDPDSKESDSSYSFNQSIGIGLGYTENQDKSLYVEPMNDSYTFNWKYHKPIIGDTKVEFKYLSDSSPVGSLGAKYQLLADTQSQNISIDLQVVDARGTTLAFQNGYINLPSGPAYDFTQSHLQVETGCLSYQNQDYLICDGSLWLDRATATVPKIPRATKDNLQEIVNYIKPLYTGIWLTLNHNHNRVGLIAFYNKTDEPGTQWKIGQTPCVKSQGTIYHNDGLESLKSEHIHIEILNLKNSNQSPHWVSPKTSVIYGTAWICKILNTTFYLFADIDQTEYIVGLDTYWEGSISIYSDPDRISFLGHGWLEQSGMN